jgi:hypothetical protein
MLAQRHPSNAKEKLNFKSINQYTTKVKEQKAAEKPAHPNRPEGCPEGRCWRAGRRLLLLPPPAGRAGRRPPKLAASEAAAEASPPIVALLLAHGEPTN